MKYWRNDFRLLARVLFCALLTLTSCSSLMAQATGSPSGFPTIVIKHLARIENNRVLLPFHYDSSTQVVCQNDTLRLGSDFIVSDNEITLLNGAASCDTITLISTSRYLLVKQHYSLHEFRTNSQVPEPPLPSVFETSQPVVSTSNLRVSGAKTFSADVSDRGATSLSQGLAMTLTGDIGRGITVHGSFSDRGLRDSRLVTKRFSELDNVYLEVESERLSGVFGTYQFKEDRFRYLNLTRNVQGLGVKYRLPNHSIESSISTPPGNYAEFTLATADGNFGPYRLQGKNGESGIAIIENSETVWFNGDKLARGRDQDYYIDYPRGELFFTGRRSIDDQDRVRVEFEYQRSEYRKTMFTAASANRFVNATAEIDLGYAGLVSARNDLLDFSLNQAEIAALKAAGDDPRKAIVPGATVVGRGNGDYTLQIDSLSDSIYVYVGDGNGDFKVTFSQFEIGDYVYLGAGRYQFVGRNKGQYLPLRSLPLPEAIQVVTVKGNIRLSDHLQFNSETALSNYDQNRFSQRDDGDNTTAACFLGMNYVGSSKVVTGGVSAEYLPQGFNRLGRLDYVDENYLWQRQQPTSGNRQRYLADVNAHFTRYDKSRLEGGFTREQGGFQSARMSLASEIRELRKSTLQLDLAFASANDRSGDNRMFDLKPRFRTALLPIAITARGEYDNRRRRTGTIPIITDSKRELEFGVDYGGVSVNGRQRENWQRQSVWSLLDRKRSLLVNVAREFTGRRKVALNVTLNRYTESGGRRQDYQTGALNLDLPQILGFIDVGSNLRLNRRGNFQTNKTYLRVNDGEGDYTLVDSVYVPQPRGNYILVTEQVGDLTQTIDTEKRMQFDVDFHRLLRSAVTAGTSLRYEVNFHEIGNSDHPFQAQWLLPSLPFFPDSARFSQRNHEYRLRRFDGGIGLSNELSYILRKEINFLDIARPTARETERGRFVISKQLGKLDHVEAAATAENSRQRELNRYSLNITKRKLELTESHSRGPWEFGVTFAVAKEKADSLSLRVGTYRVTPKAKYNLGNRGRIEVSSFIFRVSESQGHPVILQMADGFPQGTSLAANIKVDINIADNFSLKISGQGELRHGEPNRYFLRSEFISRFQ